MMNIKTLAILLSVFIFLFVLDLIRREKLTFRYALLWLSLSALGVLFAVYEKLLFKCARMVGFELPSNFIFFTVGAFFVVVSLVLTVYICQQNSRSETIAQRIGLVELELKRLVKESTGRHEPS
ncbi:MAG: DUF2304 domain-containing protein [Candidatus Omnitrophota bacterium]